MMEQLVDFVTRIFKSIAVESHVRESPRCEGVSKTVNAANNFLLEEHGAFVEAHHCGIVTIWTQSFGNLLEEVYKSNKETSIANGSKIVHSRLEKCLT